MESGRNDSLCSNTTGPLYRVDLKGGSPQPLVSSNQEWLQKGSLGHRWPVFLPDGRRFLFFLYSSDPADRSIFAGSLDSSEVKKLADADSMAAFDPNGYLIYVRQKTLVARNFDAGKIELAGEPYPLARNVQAFGETGPTGYSPFSISANGVLAQGTLNISTHLMWLDRKGKLIQTIGPPGSYWEPYFSPDEKRIVLSVQDAQGATDLWIMDSSEGSMSRFTFLSTSISGPVWSPDGTSIAFSAIQKQGWDIFLKATTGSAKEELLLGGEGDQWLDDWSRDGKFLSFVRFTPGNADLWALPMTGERKPFPYLQSPANETHSQFSPDGKWIAYGSDESGRPEVYIQGFPNPASGKFQISTTGGASPMWRRDGRELYYLAPNGNLMAVEVLAGSELNPGPPQILFRTEILQGGITDFRNQYLPSADGQRFLVIQSAGASEPLWITTNWRADLPEIR